MKKYSGKIKLLYKKKKITKKNESDDEEAYREVFLSDNRENGIAVSTLSERPMMDRSSIRYRGIGSKSDHADAVKGQRAANARAFLPFTVGLFRSAGRAV